MAERPSAQTPAERIASLVLTPFVATWDLFRKLVFGLFGVLERLDPIAAGEALVRRIGPAFVRFWREVVLPRLIAIREFLARVRQAVANFFYPLTRRIVPVIEAIAGTIMRPFRGVAAAVARSVRRIRAGLAPIVETSTRWWRRITGPFRRVSARIGERYRSVVGAARRRMRRVLRRDEVEPDYSATSSPTTEASSGASS